MIIREPIVGWRQWNFMFPHFLANVGNDTLYVPREKMEARCLQYSNFFGNSIRKDHEGAAPQPNCGCGIYAFKTKEQLLHETDAVFHKVRIVYGEINLWGTIIEHETGYRAQYAYPKRLWCSSTIEPLAGWIGYVYGVPCEVMPHEDRAYVPDESHSFNLRSHPKPKIITTKYACGHNLVVQAPYKTWTDYFRDNFRQGRGLLAEASKEVDKRGLCPNCYVLKPKSKLHRLTMRALKRMRRC